MTVWLWYPTTDPRAIPDVLAWFPMHDPTYMTLSGNLVTQLQEPISGTVLIPPVGGEPTYSASIDSNRGGSIFFDLNPKYLQSTQAASFWNFMIGADPIYVIGRVSAGSVSTVNGTGPTQRGVFISVGNGLTGTTDRGMGFRYESQNKIGAFVNQGSLGTRYTLTNTTLTPGDWSTVELFSNPMHATPASRLTMKVNGTTISGSNSSNYSGALTGNAQVPLILGATFNASSGYEQYLSGAMREIIVARGSISATNLARIYDWLNRL